MADIMQSHFHILVCLIKIWDPQGSRDVNAEPEQALYLTEVENIEIEESYKKLISTASIRFPRGTIVRKTITQENQNEVAESPDLTVNIEDNGVVIATRNYTRKAEVTDFKVGNRIKIWLGYTTDSAIADSFKLTSKKSIHQDVAKRNSFMENGSQKCLSLMFDGYIAKCSIDQPIEIKCENLAGVLKRISCPNQSFSDVTINDLLASDGQYRLLKNTGLDLHPCMKKYQINIGDIDLNSQLTLADLLTGWAKNKLYSFIKYHNGKPYIVVGRTYFSNAEDDAVIAHDSQSRPTQILFDYHVANNGLSFMDVDKTFLAVEATAVDVQGKIYRITVRRNPEWYSNKSNANQWDILNEVTISKKAQQAGATVLSQSESNKKVDLSTYTIIPYMSTQIGISHEALLEEAKKYLESYDHNGIEGTLTLFGDLALKTGTKVELVDNLHPQKNGYYLVDEVHTTFGVKGYRQKIKLPYCISRKTNETGGVKKS